MSTSWLGLADVWRHQATPQERHGHARSLRRRMRRADVANCQAITVSGQYCARFWPDLVSTVNVTTSSLLRSSSAACPSTPPCRCDGVLSSIAAVARRALAPRQPGQSPGAPTDPSGDPAPARERYPAPNDRLHLRVTVAGTDLILATNLMASLHRDRLGEKVASVADRRSDVVTPVAFSSRASDHNPPALDTRSVPVSAPPARSPRLGLRHPASPVRPRSARAPGSARPLVHHPADCAMIVTDPLAPSLCRARVHRIMTDPCYPPASPPPPPDAPPCPSPAPAPPPRSRPPAATAPARKGPVTAEGKARASRNALKHGLTAIHHLVLEDEVPDDLDELIATDHRRDRCRCRDRGPPRPPARHRLLEGRAGGADRDRPVRRRPQAAPAAARLRVGGGRPAHHLRPQALQRHPRPAGPERPRDRPLPQGAAPAPQGRARRGHGRTRAGRGKRTREPAAARQRRRRNPPTADDSGPEPAAERTRAPDATCRGTSAELDRLLAARRSGRAWRGSPPPAPCCRWA